MKKQTRKEIEAGVYRLDKVDEEMIRILTKNARIPAKDLAVALNISRAMSDYRLDRLVSTGIITSFSIDVDWSKVAE